MLEKSIYKLKINESFKRLIPALSSEELHQLEQNIIRDGCREPLCVWNNTIIDGHNRYEICTRLNIPFSFQRIYFRNFEEAIAWICANQLGRRNITDEMRKYLIGKRYEMEKILGAHNTTGTNQHSKKKVRAKMLPEPTYDKTAGRTSERLGKEYNISHASVKKYGSYSNALDKLSEVIPHVIPKILSGQVKISHENIMDLSQLPPQDIFRLTEYVSDNTNEFVRYASIRKVLPKNRVIPKLSTPSLSTFTIKDIPVYDPDAEISSLSLTIPSWVSSINRMLSAANFSAISSNARYKLKKELLGLKDIIDTTLTVMKEEI